ncbi:uncharacterized protein LTR77_004463 [Saxophila tyrrhenica]|uniref:Glycosyltransferase family 28 N-terminal domain-containing protein n=1 Tax=Saxophila tyrrhenica TaxID=1690608 RepID=A0AAV9PCS5_9PEZI|nr:hypothetical protein LTR77_004463 [Saxophila tyrrhenica]
MAPSKDKKPQESEAEIQGSVPRLMVQQAEAAAASEQDPSDETAAERRHQGHDVPPRTETNELDLESELPDHPPPAYGEHFGHIANNQEGYDTKADVADDGRVNIRINQRNRQLSSLLVPALRHQQEITDHEHALPPPYIPPGLGGEEGVPPPPPMNVVIQIVGSRGDVQPFVALGKVLKDTYGHRVRLATHPNFKDFVTENGLEFFNIGGDPSELMAFMVKNPGLMPGFDSLRSGDVGNRRREVAAYLKGCWRSCFETGDGLGPEASDNTIEDWSSQQPGDGDFSSRPFVADCIIANPPSFAHVHCAEKLGLPLHIMFTMPYTPTQAFPHPLANIQSSNADPHLTNYMSYSLIDMLTWQGLGDVINRFRQKSLGLDPISLIWAPGMLQRLKIPHTYCWSPALIPKPKDWGQDVSISGFFFLNLASNYTPAPDLKQFLDSGPPPVYIGFGSIVLDDPNAMTELIFEAVRITGQRVLLSKGWGGMGAEDLGIPEGVFMLGNVPHDWLFNHVSCVVHHGGAGTTAAGITAGKPTVVVPFFGDQPFWGAMVARAGAGPDPLPHKELTGQKLADAINFCLKPESQQKAGELAASIAKETGSQVGAQSFHQMLDVDKLRCTVAPSHAAVWRVKRTEVRLSALAACTLANANLLDFNDLKLFRAREYETDDGPWDPITGGATAIVGTATQVMMGVADFPIETLKALKIHPETAKKKNSKDSKTESADGRTESDLSSKDTGSSSSTRESVTTESPITSAGATPTASRTNSSFNMQESLSRLQSGSSDTETLRPHSNSMSDALKGQLKDAKSRSRSGSRSRPGSRSAAAPESGAKPDYMDAALGTSKGVGRIIGAGFKSPMDFSMAVTKGFRNAPKLYGDDTVRKTEQVTDFRSGQKVAWKEFGLGLYDGISGLVTQPVKGAQKEGAAGFVKGFGKGIGGVVFKPAAAGFGIAGYTMKGVYKEMQKNMGASVQNYIIAARTAQGYEEWQLSSEGERKDIINRWQAMQKDIKRKRDPDEIVRTVLEEQRKKAQAYIKTGWEDKKPRRLSRAGKTSPGGASASTGPEAAMLDMGAGEGGSASSTADQATIENNELEEAIRRSVQETSQGDPEADAEVERAIRASMAELAKSRAERAQEQATQADKDQGSQEQDEELKQAIAASVADADNQQQQRMVHDEELERALAQSLKEQRRQRSSDSEWDSDEDNEDYDVGASAATQHGPASAQNPPEYDVGHVAGTTQADYEGQGSSEKTQQERNEEQVVLDYVKKQSMLEQQHRQAAAGKGKAAQRDEDDEELQQAIKMSQSSGEACGSK